MEKEMLLPLKWLHVHNEDVVLSHQMLCVVEDSLVPEVNVGIFFFNIKARLPCLGIPVFSCLPVASLLLPSHSLSYSVLINSPISMVLNSVDE